MAETVADRVEQADDTLVHKRGAEKMSIVPWGPDGLRVRITAGPAIADTTWALTEPIAAVDSTVTIDDEEAVIRNGRISASISDIRTQKGYLQFFRHSGETRTSILREHDYVVGAHNPGTRLDPVGSNSTAQSA